MESNSEFKQFFRQYKAFFMINLTITFLGIFAFIFIIHDYSLVAIYDDFINIKEGDKVHNFVVVFISILVEAAPFIMIGAFVSAIIQVFLSEQMIARLIPKNKLVGLFVASLAGFVFPVCECAIVPIMRRLLKKGVPLYISVTFMLAVPIVNPVVLASTYYAFSANWTIVIQRAVLGMFGAILIGSIVDKIHSKAELFKDDEQNKCCCSVEGDEAQKQHFLKKIWLVFEFASEELYEIGRFLILGALLATFMQFFLPKSILYSLGEGKVLSILVLMFMTFTLSLCSEIDAFIGRTFVSQFTSGSIIAFLIYGPMIDIKNVIMLSGFFKGKFIVKLVGIITLVCFIIGLVINYLVML